MKKEKGDGKWEREGIEDAKGKEKERKVEEKVNERGGRR